MAHDGSFGFVISFLTSKTAGILAHKFPFSTRSATLTGMRWRSGYLLLFLLLDVRALYADEPVTFNNQVVRILQQHCQTCHRPGNIAPMSLLTYTDVRPWARAIRAKVLTKEMPPWKPVNAHDVFKSERSLTDREIQMLSDWADHGAPEGDPLDVPEPMTFSDTWSGGVPDLVAQPSESYPLSSGGADIYRCFPM